ncbi:MAG TPA: SpvB/TcaC N-terminal domain-containing protein [Candidatus Aquirickettsiella sp.]
MPMDSADKIVTPELNFPKGGGTIQGLGEAVGNGGMLGTATLSIPLPISPARSLTPGLALSYSSGAGNSPFGLGFFLSISSISRRVAKGVPSYTDEDEFLYFNREVLVPAADSVRAEHEYQVRRFYPRLEGGFDKIEYWQHKTDKNDQFWRVYQADGTQHILGKTAAAKISDPKKTENILRWLLEETVAVNGEHILYTYKAEDSEGIDFKENPAEAAREHTAERYLKQVCYANREGSSAPYLLEETLPSADNFLFELLFDYGEHAANQEDIPSYREKNTWLLRADSFSDYVGGFEIRSHRLCRQVLMFHRFDELGSDPALVASLVLEYAENPILTYLEAAYQRGYGISHDNQVTQASLPPIELKYQTFAFHETDNFVLFEPFTALAGLNSDPYQLVDLYGEGLPGILYRDGSSVLYRAPQRIENTDDPNAIEYAPWQTLPRIPTGGLASQPGRTLMDLTGDGQLDWVISLPGMAGFFSLNSDKSWQHFIPFSAFPSEFNQPRAYLADIMGAGLSDLILIGPNSVRLYANQRKHGFSPPIEVEYGKLEQGDVPLPSANPCETEVVAFSDILGSGQQHLVRIRYNEIVCWPNLGRGKFAKPIKLANLPFKYEKFSAKQVFLADIDGSGATDFLYVESNHIKIFLNQSGNGFADPYELKFPPSIRYDDLAQLSFADVRGNGSSCLIFTITHPQVQHWIYDFNAGGKPYLLEQMNNNRGLNTCLHYRSSAQEWLDEKKENANAVSHLPFPVHLLSTITQKDEVSGSQFKQHFCYRQGYYDGLEREFVGFAYVAHYDCEDFSELKTENEKISFSPPVLTKVWYHTGAAQIDQSTYYAGDKQAIELGEHRLIDRNNQLKGAADESLQREFRRALRGSVLRQEVFSVANDEVDNVSNTECPWQVPRKTKDPYSVSSFRYQVRVQQEKEEKHYPVLLASLLEEISYHYDQVPDDPRCDHQINLEIDRYGVLIDSATINYPRRGLLNAKDPYFDEEQFVLRLQRGFLDVVHLDQGAFWRLGLPYQERVEVTVFPAPIPEKWQGTLSYEKLAGAEGLLATLAVGDIIVWNHYHYWSPEKKLQLPLGEASPEGLIAQIFTADIKQTMLKTVLEEIPDTDVEDPEALEAELIQKGCYSNHRSSNTKFPRYYWMPSDGPSYSAINTFFRVDSQLDPFTNETRYAYDSYSYALASITDALGSKITALYNYRVLKIWQTEDSNKLKQQVAFDPLGRVIVSTFRGIEDNNEAGFDLLDSYKPTVMTLAEAITDPDTFIQKAAAAYFYDSFSWMGKISVANLKKMAGISSPEALFKKLQSKGFITAAGYVKAKARWHSETTISLDTHKSGLSIAVLLKTLWCTPPHAAIFTADNYSEATKIQIRITVAYSDGFDRGLQAKQLVPAGKAYVDDENGGLLVENDALVEKEATNRWVVSKRIDTNNKGFPVRKYQSYFINTYQYVQDTALQKYGYYDSVFYDALGREFKFVNAAGFFRRTTYHPWFLHVEDENDTWAEVVLQEEDKNG